MKKNIFKHLAMLMAMVFMFGMTGCSSSDSFKEGTYKGVGTGKNGNVEVEVKFSDSEIKSVKVLKHSETEGISDAAIKELPNKILENQSLAVDAITGATLMSDAILQAVEDCVVQAGGDVEKLKQVKETGKEKEVEEVSTDIVVLGAGASGTAAAIAGVDNGAKVLLLEKTAIPMGAGTLAGGMFAADSQQQKDNNATVSKEWLYDQYVLASDGFMNSVLVREIIDEAGPTVDWLEENGCDFNLADAGTGGGYEHIGMPATLHGYAEGGTVAINKLIDSFKSKGGEVRFSTPATELIKDDKGNITGVMAKKADGSTLKVNAKSVIIATGGYGGSEEMLKENFGKSYTKGEIAQNTGDGIKMAWNAGADEYGTDVAQYFWAKFTDEETAKLAEALGDDWYALTNFTRYPNLRVNNLGQRFSDETNTTIYSTHGAQISMQPEQEEYVIVDSNMLNKMKKGGGAAIEDQFAKWKDDPQFFMEFNEPNDTRIFYEEDHSPVDYAAMFDKTLDTGVVFKSDTLEGLAKEMKVNEENFMSSVNQYNNAIKNGKDELFFSDSSRLLSLEEGPYYAIKFSARNLGTLGGIRINEKIEVVDEKGMPIDGLYAAGADAGGMYGKAYVDFEGGTLGFAYTSGRLAGINASKYVTGK
ncbi:FAD-binding protein [Romboutsia sp.]|uniref:FAD-binding protein n=1 Tax=Romboutsia sp. TaxID=1965302 RepID=UPI003F344462